MHFEGGDVVLDYPYVYVGVSHPEAEHGEATNMQFVKTLQTRLGTTWQVMGVPLSADVLHLDLVFNMVPSTKRNKSCLLWPQGIAQGKRSAFYRHLRDTGYMIHEVTNAEATQYVCNFINVEPGHMVVSDSKEMRNVLKRIQVMDDPDMRATFIEFSTVYAILGGSIRCSTMPILRGHVEAPFVTNETDRLQVCVVGRLTEDKLSPVCVKAYAELEQNLAEYQMTRNVLLQHVNTSLETLAGTLQKAGVVVLRPSEEAFHQVRACNAIFARDVGCVVGKEILYASLHLPHRKDEHLATQTAVDAFLEEQSRNTDEDVGVTNKPTWVTTSKRLQTARTTKRSAAKPVSPQKATRQKRRTEFSPQ